MRPSTADASEQLMTMSTYHRHNQSH